MLFTMKLRIDVTDSRPVLTPRVRPFVPLSPAELPDRTVILDVPELTAIRWRQAAALFARVQREIRDAIQF